MDVNPIELQKHLKGISYPASKDDVVSTAESNGAPGDIVDALRDSGQEEFSGPDQVTKALA